MTIQLGSETRRRLREAIVSWCSDELDVEVGELKTERLLDSVMDTIGTAVHNQAIDDARAWLEIRLMDMEGDLHEGPS